MGKHHHRQPGPPLSSSVVIPRYSLPEMSAIWSEERKLALWTQVEILALEAWVKLGIAPKSALQALRQAPPVDPAAVAAREEVTNHDLAAFVDVLSGSMAEGGAWVHHGLTSSDVLDTAGAVQLRDASTLLLSRVKRLFEVVRERAMENRDTVMVGRTHGIWAEPTTMGLKLASWAFELGRDHPRLAGAARSVAVGKVSGAVGTYAHIPPQVEEHVCAELGLEPEPAATQVVARDRHAEFLSTLALVGASLERFATEIRHLQRSEVGEAREPFRSGQKGSSAMPHKRNPIVSERMAGLARLLRGYAQVGLENVALWHERDISHSSAERVAIPDACLALDYALVTFTKTVERLEIDVARMAANLEATRGLVYSQSVLLALVATGWSRDDAYRLVQRNALRAWDERRHLAELLAKDPEVDLSSEQLAACFQPESMLEHSAVIFERLEKLVLSSE
jgi:adenylosuccinate lyase